MGSHFPGVVHGVAPELRLAAYAAYGRFSIYVSGIAA